MKIKLNFKLSLIFILVNINNLLNCLGHFIKRLGPHQDSVSSDFRLRAASDLGSAEADGSDRSSGFGPSFDSEGKDSK